MENANAVILDWSIKLTDLFLESPLLNDAMSYFSNPQCSMFPVLIQVRSHIFFYYSLNVQPDLFTNTSKYREIDHY